MKILLLYYTGTFNTRYLTNLLKDRLIKEHHEVAAFEIDGFSKSINLDEFDLIGLGYPIYAFNSPHIFNRYLKTLKFESNKSFFIYKQSGEVFHQNNASSRFIKSWIKKNRGNLLVEHHFVLPYNIHFRMPDSFIKEALIIDDLLLDILIYELQNGIIDIIKSSTLDNINSILFSIQKPGGPINGLFYKVDNTKCIKCMKCVNNCIVKNITYKNNKFKFKNKCQMCMRCSFTCPQDAIHIGLIDKRRVNKPFDLDKIKSDESIKQTFITGKEKGFYSCFNPYFKKIKEKHDSYFK